MSFQELPPEVIEHMLDYLGYKEIIRCSQVCHRLSSIISASSWIQYKVELGMNAMVDVPSNTTATPERLLMLRSRRLAWDSLRWTRCETRTVNNSCDAYELVGGIFARLSSMRHFLAFRLPSKIEPAQDIFNAYLDFLARDFAMDPSQDLIIFLEDQGLPAALNIRTLSNHQPHPTAKTPRIPIPHLIMMHVGFAGSGLIQICEDRVALFYGQRGVSITLFIWDWKTGDIITLNTFRDDGDQPMDFTFLNPSYYVLTLPAGHGAIALYHVGENVPSAKLLCPTPTEQCGHVLEALAIHTGPFYANPPSDSPFTTAKTSRIHVITLDYSQPSAILRPHSQIHCYIWNETLLEFASLSPFSSCKTKIIPWKDWGPKNTRMLDGIGRYSWLRFVQGSRVVLPVGKLDEHPSIRILDFNVSRPSEPDPDNVSNSLPELPPEHATTPPRPSTKRRPSSFPPSSSSLTYTSISEPNCSSHSLSKTPSFDPRAQRPPLRPTYTMEETRKGQEVAEEDQDIENKCRVTTVLGPSNVQQDGTNTSGIQFVEDVYTTLPYRSYKIKLPYDYRAGYLSYMIEEKRVLVLKGISSQTLIVHTFAF